MYAISLQNASHPSLRAHRLLSRHIRPKVGLARPDVSTHWRWIRRRNVCSVYNDCRCSNRGGKVGQAIFCSLRFTIDRQRRSTAFFRVTGAALFALFIGYPAASILMSINVWLPMFLATILLMAGMLCIFTVPETLPRKMEPELRADSDETQLIKDEYSYRHWIMETLLPEASKSIHETFELLRNPSVGLLCAAFLVTQLGGSSIGLLLQYASEKFNWSFARVSTGQQARECRLAKRMVTKSEPNRIHRPTSSQRCIRLSTLSCF